jgi:hypothetical protein
MKHTPHLTLLLITFSLIGYGCTLISPNNADSVAYPTPDATKYESDLEAAEHALIAFFDALSRHDYRTAALYTRVPNPLTYLYPDIDRENGEALLTKACNDVERRGCRFYCWKIKDVVNRTQASPDEFFFSVRFENYQGDLLIGGDNVTPRVCDPPGCTHSEYAYTVIKRENRFLVDGLPVFTGCWP